MTAVVKPENLGAEFDIGGTVPNKITLVASQVLASLGLRNCAGGLHAPGAQIPTCGEMTAAIAAALAAAPADVFLDGLQSYDPATNTLTLNMSDGSAVPVDMTAIVNDAIAQSAPTIAAAAPAGAPAAGESPLHVNTAVTPSQLSFWDGTAWVAIDPVDTFYTVGDGANVAIPNGTFHGQKISIEGTGSDAVSGSISGLFVGTYRSAGTGQQPIDAGNHATNFVRGGETVKGVWNGALWVTSFDYNLLRAANYRENTDGTYKILGAINFTPATDGEIVVANLPFALANNPNSWNVTTLGFINAPQGAGGTVPAATMNSAACYAVHAFSSSSATQIAMFYIDPTGGGANPGAQYFAIENAIRA